MPAPLAEQSAASKVAWSNSFGSGFVRGIMRHILLATAMIALCGPAAAQITTGKLGTLPQGNYICAEPGDAGGAAWNELPGKEFTIGNGSTYHTSDGSGTYLLTGKNVAFTRGPMKGMRFLRAKTATLRRVDSEGNPGRIRCIRSSTSR